MKRLRERGRLAREETQGGVELGREPERSVLSFLLFLLCCALSRWVWVTGGGRKVFPGRRLSLLSMCSSVLLLCPRFHGEGYREGYEEGSSLGIIEGRQHGTLHGAKIGSEVSGNPCVETNPFHVPFIIYSDGQDEGARASGLFKWQETRQDVDGEMRLVRNCIERMTCAGWRMTKPILVHLSLPECRGAASGLKPAESSPRECHVKIFHFHLRQNSVKSIICLLLCPLS